MRFTTQLISALVLSSFGAAAMAIEAEQDSTWIPTASTKSRAEVRAETQDAKRAGKLFTSEHSFTVAVPSGASTLTRAQVTAEAREAMRLGLIPVQEGNYRFATPAENEQIRQAGLRAVKTDSEFAAK